MYPVSRVKIHRTVALLVAAACLFSQVGISAQSRAATSARVVASLVNTIHTSAWTSPSPDPAGVVWWPAGARLVVVDSEVDEFAWYTGTNLFQSTTGGALISGGTVPGALKDPTDIEIVRYGTSDHFLISDDIKKVILDVDLGADGQFGTPDDAAISFSTAAFNNNDPEGLAYGDGKLFIADGMADEVYVLSPGANGRFDGVPPAGDDSVTSFDTLSFGFNKLEGIAYNPANNSLYLVSHNAWLGVAEVSLTGELLRVINISFLNAISPSDLTLAPGSVNPLETNLYISERGVDNNVDPNENDGKIFEVRLSSATLTGNLLSNPGFEIDANGDSRPDSWEGSPLFSKSDSIAYSGTFAGRFASSADEGSFTRQTINDISDALSYRLSGWVNIPATNDTLYLRFKVRWLDANLSEIRVDTVKSFNDDTVGTWLNFDEQLNPPNGARHMQITMSVISLNGEIFVDELQLQANDLSLDQKVYLPMVMK